MARRPASVRLSVLLAALLLGVAAYVAVGQYRAWTRAALVGLTDRPCAGSEVVTGEAYDDWAARCFYRAQNARLTASGRQPEVVMIGDSLTMGWPDQGEAIVSRGIGQQSSAQILLRFMPDAMKLHPRVVHILAGTNDVAGTTGPVSPDQLGDNLLAMVDIARARGVTVILGTIPPARGLGPGDTRAAIARANEQIALLARTQPGVVLADYHAALARPDGSPREDLFLDGVHPNAAGYAAMQPVFEGALETARVTRGPARARPQASGTPPSSR